MEAVIGVIGESQFSDPAHEALAEETGRLLAEAGYVLVCGGLGGVMEAACRGARRAGGLTVGILPGVDRRDANPYVTVAVATGLGQMRNVAIVLTADALIAIGGGYGTLSEIGHALRAGKPVIGLRTWEAVRAGTRAPVTVVQTPREAVEAVRAALADRR
ncbi:MAG: TIGR00725 family protein [Armatimonadota bacterium]|nr:TIGR00725 family protein [Armatimonadota bacterium]MDR7401796.1 TIGR00725 family protein [Armatimonadota bacterium]MDR7403098.1 TIGR00725 family protein [Armatimonadota bacterium]MDR7436199.1 TIGR00725 family protein [Armatimonadota bacterium]MDR7471420.1 TIGR00725 family protein [Armatimonadota bacterium]